VVRREHPRAFDGGDSPGAAGEPDFAGYDTQDFESHTRGARAEQLTDEHRQLPVVVVPIGRT